MINETQTHIRSWERWFLILLCVSALALRFIYLSEIRGNPFFDHPRLDALFHDTWAASIASGDILGDTVFFRAPVYPYFLGGLYAIFGHNYIVPRIAQHLLGVAGLLFLYFLSRRIFGVREAVLASLLASLYAVVIYFEGELLFDSMLTFACLVWFFMVERIRQQRSLVHWLTIGCTYGIICCIRPTFLAIAPFIFCSLIWRCFKSWTNVAARKAFIVLILGCLLPILPIAIRNYVVGNDFTLIASQGGVNFYIGNNRAADGHSSMMPGFRGTSWENRDLTFFVGKVLGHTPSPSEESWYWYKKGIQFIVDQPLQYFTLLVKKIYLFWNWYEIPNNQNFYSFREYSNLLRVLPIGFWLVGPLGLVGMMAALWYKQGRFHVAFVILYSSVIILFFVCDRFRLPIVPLLCMFAAYALITMFDLAKKKEWGHLLLIGAIITTSATFVNSSLYAIDKDTSTRDFLSLGIVELDKGNYAQASAYFEHSVVQNANPPPNVYLNWGVAEWGLGNTSQAIGKFNQELLHYPDTHGALSNLAYVYLSLGTMDSAIYYGREAVNAKPYLPKPYIAIAKAYLAQKNMDSAASILEEGLHACGENFLYGELLLAGTYQEMGKIELAEQHYRSIIERRSGIKQPSYEPELTFVGQDEMQEDEKRMVAKAMYGMGNIWAGRGNIDSAISNFRSAVAGFPDYADAWADLGVAYMHTRQYADADNALVKALRVQPQNHLYWYNYGTLLGTLGRLSEASDAFKKTLAIRRDFEPARQRLALTEGLLKKQR